MEVLIRHLPFAIADGATNMTADEVMVHTAAQGGAVLRFYGWTTATLSLGYFQSSIVRSTDPRLAALPFVRRPSGGATLVHHHELTYALALPPGSPWHSSEPWMRRVHRLITSALAELGLAGRIEMVEQNPVKHGEVLCFQQYTVGDLLCSGKKVVGSAQRKYHQALMQHGSILLAQSEHTPALPGILELTGVALTASQVSETLLKTLMIETGWSVEESDWTEQEQDQIRELSESKYSASWWNEKR